MSKPESHALSLTGSFPLSRAGPATAGAARPRGQVPSLKLLRLTFLGTGGLSFALGLLSWTGHGGAVVGLHGPVGILAVIALWTLAVRAARAAVPVRTAALAAVWGLVALVVGATHNFLLPGSWHWTLQVGHLALSMGMMATGRRLLATVAQSEATARPDPRPTIAQAAAEFLSARRIAVTGVSRTPQAHAGSSVYRHLRERGYQVFAVNPETDQVEGDRSYPDLASIPGGVEAVVIGTRPELALDTVRECAELGIKQVWMHRGFGGGSVSAEATAWGRAHGIRVIDGGCPLMFAPGDVGHRVMRCALTVTGKLPSRVE